MHKSDCIITFNGEIYNFVELKKLNEFVFKQKQIPIFAAYKKMG